MAFDLGSIVPTIPWSVIFWGVLIAILIGACVIIFLMPNMIKKTLKWLNKRSYKIPVIIFSKRQNSPIIKYDKAKRMKDADGTYSFDLYTNDIIKPPKLDEVMVDNTIILVEKDHGSYESAVMDLERNTITNMSSEDKKYWIADRLKSEQLYKSEKITTNQILQIAVPIILIGILLIGGVINYNQMSKNNLQIMNSQKAITDSQSVLTEKITILFDKLGIKDNTDGSTTGGTHTW